MVAAVRTAKQFLTYVNAGPFQPAVAAGLQLPDAYFTEVAKDLEYRRDVLVQGLREGGLPVISPEATYFATVDVRGVQADGDGLAFCRALPSRAGVVAIPSGVFYSAEHAALGRHLVRFAFCKGDDVLGEAVTRLAGMGRAGG
jgi:N-succinyldiaminopimelate aminotransferase